MLSISIVGFAQETSKYLRYLDSADVKVNNDPDLAMQYLDTIPLPLEKHISGHLAEYYNSKALIYETKNQQTELFQNFLLALQYAEKEENHYIAGFASHELFYNLYITKKDTVAFEYLEKAKYHYEKANHKYGLLDVMQSPAFVQFHDGNYQKSNELIMPKLDYYKSIKEDGYYYMNPLFMLTSNYLHLEDSTNARKYFKRFKSLENDSTIPTSLHNRYKITLLVCSAKYYNKTKQLDSARYYFSKARELRTYMNSSDVKNYYNSLIDYYGQLNDKEAQQHYVDSLDAYQSELFDKAMNVNFKVSKSLVQSNEGLMAESEKKEKNRIWIIVLGSLLIGLIIFITVKYKQIKEKFIELTQRKNEYSYLQKNHEKLKVKVQGLEKFISESKKDIKRISNIDDAKKQKEQIKELYRNIHLHSSTLIDNGENHLKLINELNVDFFNKISTKHPQLNHSEIIICYYIYTGFKNKDIAAFLNTSVRAVESKRYRITKKINLNSKNTTLHQYLLGALNN
ncbi:LuxR C-terminal-related transcriptional regulator [Psychroserpens sp. SPM9]|uniref:helix-turn-helix transcriptional regulator n=1 Tax=Psychroserpens sp. SPM9 TaxID=2975598 RepID=UPI0021A8F21F|nr:LuxR C-terminal-related transcriptional regulator [Psychroserpens sp. SPM9]MDG5492949.1 LuxR C-terminal-related transcriptional regulator [Psychroserpens sp. SPM9]